MIMSDEVIYLSAKRDGDAWIVVDQHGRQLRGVIGLTIRAATDEPTQLSIECFDYSTGDRPTPHTGARRNAG